MGSTYGSSGSGQIRTNQFFQFPWLLKELRLLLDCAGPSCSFSVVPTMVKVNPFDELWNENVANNPGPFKAQAMDFQADLTANSGELIKALASTSFDSIGYPVDLAHDAAESAVIPTDAPPALPTQLQPPDDYLPRFLSGPASGFRATFASFVPAGLSAQQVVRRATALSCAGCHNPSSFGLTAANAIGNATLSDGTIINSWPDSAGFVHVSEASTGPAPGVFPISPALRDVFLPSREKNFVARLTEPTCLCENKFLKLPEAARTKAIKVQKDVRAKLKVKLNELRRAPADGAPPLPLQRRQAFQQRVVDLGRANDDELRRALKAEDITVEEPLTSSAVVPDELDVERRAGGDAKKARALRQQAVIEQVKSEPPRRTVTGSFRVH